MTKKLNDLDRLKIARFLAVLDRDAVIGIREAAVLLNTTLDRLYQASSPARVARGDISLKLPPRVLAVGRKLGWRHGDIRDLVVPATPNPARSKSVSERGSSSRKGRPRKA